MKSWWFLASLLCLGALRGLCCFLLRDIFRVCPVFWSPPYLRTLIVCVLVASCMTHSHELSPLWITKPKRVIVHFRRLSWTHNDLIVVFRTRSRQRLRCRSVTHVNCFGIFALTDDVKYARTCPTHNKWNGLTFEARTPRRNLNYNNRRDCEDVGCSRRLTVGRERNRVVGQTKNARLV